VDDIKEQRDLAAFMLERLGYRVDTVSSGREAVDYIRNAAVDVLVLDMILEPGMDGLETYKEILSLSPGQKAIIASGFSESERVLEAQRVGAGRYIKKPYRLEQIGMALKEQLAGQPARQGTEGQAED
jgi:CheY-like chemotaxis protein